MSARAQSVFHAIGEPTRRRLLDALAAGPRSAGALARRFPASRPAVARHLGVLRRSGLVLVKAEGRRRIYTLNPSGLRAVSRWIARYDRFWKARSDDLTRYVRVEAARETGDL
jgi:DNA-binding transcriptional ArsR family regulator